MTLALTLAALLATGAPPPLACKGQKPGDKKVQTLRQTIEGGELFRFAVEKLGALASCSVEVGHTVLGADSTLVYEFPRGNLQYFNSSDSTEISLTPQPGALDEAAVRAFLQRAAALKRARIDFKKKGEITREGDEATESWESPGEVGPSARIHTKGGKLVRLDLTFMVDM